MLEGHWPSFLSHRKQELSLMWKMHSWHLETEEHTPLLPEVGNLGREAGINKLCYFFLLLLSLNEFYYIYSCTMINYLKPKLWYRYFANKVPKAKTLSSSSQIFFFLLSKKYKSCLLWLGFISVRLKCAQIKIYFSPVNLSHVSFIISPATRIQEGLR